MDKRKTLMALARLQLAYPNALDDERMNFYVTMLADVPPELMAAGVTYCINHCRFLPSIAELREATDKAAIMATGGPDANSSAEAWGRVKKAIASVGHTGKPDFSDDPVLARVVDRFGWLEICQTPAEDTSILRAQFRKAYEADCRQQTEIREFAQAGVTIHPRLTGKDNSGLRRIGDAITITLPESAKR